MAALTPRLIGSNEGFEGSGETIERQYQVQCTLVSDGALAARLAVLELGIPSGYYLTRLKSQHIQRSPLWFLIEVSYALAVYGLAEPNPLLRPSKLTSTYEEATESYFFDKSDPPQMVLNAAGDRYSEFPQRRTGKMVLQITKNIETFPAVAYDLIKYSRNTEEIVIRDTTYAIHTLLLLPVTCAETYEVTQAGSFHYYQTLYRLAVDHMGHQDVFDERGFYRINHETFLREKIRNADGSDLDTPWPLYSAGGSGDGDVAGEMMPNAKDAPDQTTYLPYGSMVWGLNFD